MKTNDENLVLRLATTPDDLRAAQRLRYEVFVAELGGDGALVDHQARLETDAFDPFFDHLVLVDTDRDTSAYDHVVGVYRVLRDDQAAKMGRFYSEDEYDLSPLKSSGRRLLELGRSCLHADYRGGTAMYHMWSGLARYVLDHQIEVLFGVASFHGADIAPLKQPLAYLYHNHLAPEDLRVTALSDNAVDMNLLPKDQLDRKAAMLATPALIKAYLRLGGCIGDGAYVDHAFNTIDVCLIMDTTRMNAQSRARYTKEGAA